MAAVPEVGLAVQAAVVDFLDCHSLYYLRKLSTSRWEKQETRLTDRLDKALLSSRGVI